LLAQLETGNILAMNAASAYMKCRQFANGAAYDEDRNVHEIHSLKLDALDELIDELSGKPLLAFFQFSHDAARIKKRHPDARVLSGKTPKADALKSIAQWNRGEIPLFLIQIAAGSHGLNLQHGPCADVAYFGLTDSFEKYDQSFRRVYRSGQKSKQVRVHRLLCRGSVDDIMAARVEGKHKTQEEFFQALLRHARS
jgi:SNF2 family DNA or RNA helicase